jgi:UDP-glucose 4-epimerase
MRCCVVGGYGFIGRYLCTELLRKGRSVVAIGRHAAPDNSIPGVEYIACDVNDRKTLRSVLDDCEEVVDLAYATIPKTSFLDPSHDLISNLPRVVGMMEELRSCRKLRRLVLVSSGGTVYGPVSHLPIVEEMPTSPISPYGITKLAIEHYASMYFHLHGVPSIVVRPSNAYGVGQRPFSGQGFIATAIGNIVTEQEIVVFGNPGTVRDYLHVQDLAAGIVASLDYGIDGEVYNIGSGIGRSNLDIIELIRPLSESEKLPISIRHEPARIFDVPTNVLDCGRLYARSGWIPRIPIELGLMEMWEDLVRLNHRTKK